MAADSHIGGGGGLGIRDLVERYACTESSISVGPKRQTANTAGLT